MRAPYSGYPEYRGEGVKRDKMKIHIHSTRTDEFGALYNYKYMACIYHLQLYVL